MRLSFLLFAFPLFSFYIGNPASPGIMNAGIFGGPNPFIKATSGYIADYTFDQTYYAKRVSPNLDPNEMLKKFSIHSQMASLSLILLERLELFAYVGGSKEKASLGRDPTLSDTTAIFFDFSSSYHFSWAVGAKAIFLQWGQTFLSTDFTYFTVPYSSHSYFQFFNRLNLPLVEKQEFQMEEWQISTALASKIWILTPYLGGVYLHSKLHVEGSSLVPALDYKNDDRVGWFYGLTLSLTGKLHLNVERRRRAESAYAFATVLVF